MIRDQVDRCRQESDARNGNRAFHPRLREAGPCSKVAAGPPGHRLRPAGRRKLNAGCRVIGSVRGSGPRRSSAVSILALAITLFPSAAAGRPADGDLAIRLGRVGGVRSTPQGTPFRFWVRVQNSGGDQSPLILIELTSPSSGVKDIRSWRPFLPAGESMSIEMSQVSSQWFEEIGTFGLTAKLQGSPVSNTLRYTVTEPLVSVPRFEDVSAARGLSSVLPTDVDTSHSAGAAWGDVNDDGYLDLFVPIRDQPAQLWVFHPETWSFLDEAASWDVTNPDAKGVGAVFADYDNDGDQDVYVVNDALDPETALPTGQGNRLYRNDFSLGRSTFTDVSAAAGVGVRGNGASASWGDYDNDGYIDLYVVTNNAFNLEEDGPEITYYQQDHLFHNGRDGTFVDVTCSVLPTNDRRSGFCPGRPGFGGTTGSGFQAVWIDYDRDGDQDLYVAQDFLRIAVHSDINRLYRNEGFNPSTGAWEFADLCAQVPERSECLKINSMGIAVGDYDNDGWPDIAISNTGGNGGNAMLKNNGDGTFTEIAEAVGVDRPVHDARVNATTWGLGFYDFNLDAFEDLYVAAGSIGQSYNQPNQLFVNSGASNFLDLSAPSRAADPGVGHGVAFADYDRDGLIDMYLVNVNGVPGGPSVPRLYENVTSTAGHWLELKLVGTTSNRDACGARVVMTSEGSSGLSRWVLCGTSLGSGSDTVLHFGGVQAGSFTIHVHWPSGLDQTFASEGVDRLVWITEGD